MKARKRSWLAGAIAICATLLLKSCSDDDAPPVILELQPAAGAQLIGSVWFSAQVEPGDHALASVRFLVDGQAFGEFESANPRALHDLGGLAAGVHAFRVEATDRDGGVASAAIDFSKLAHPLGPPALRLDATTDTVALGQWIEQELWLEGLDGLRNGRLVVRWLPFEMDSCRFEFDADHVFDLAFAQRTGWSIDVSFTQVPGDRDRFGTLRVGVLRWKPTVPGEQAQVVEELELLDGAGEPIPRFAELARSVEQPLVVE